jgi:hypothetical protein
MKHESGGNGVHPPVSTLCIPNAALPLYSSANAVNQNKDSRKSLDVGLWQINDMVSVCDDNDYDVGFGGGGDGASVVQW